MAAAIVVANREQRRHEIARRPLVRHDIAPDHALDAIHSDAAEADETLIGWIVAIDLGSIDPVRMLVLKISISSTGWT